MATKKELESYYKTEKAWRIALQTDKENYVIELYTIKKLLNDNKTEINKLIKINESLKKGYNRQKEELLRR